MQFKLKSDYQPTGDQPQAIKKLVSGVKNNKRDQVLLGVTGSGKTFTMANVIEQTQKPTLVIAHNKTLAAQLYQEFRDFFPENAVNYFVSYYDYYQPEAYIPTTDTYIEKEAQINDEIDKLRLSATANLLTRPDVIVVASVSCIYNLGNPVDYDSHIFELIEGELISRQTLLLQLANLQYERNDTDFHRGTYRVRGDTIQVWPAYQDTALKIETLENKITQIQEIEPMSGAVIKNLDEKQAITDHKGRYMLYPAKHYMVDPQSEQKALVQIRQDMKDRVTELKKQGKELEAYRLEKKINYDLEMLQEFGFVNGIENYSRYFDGRQPGQPPYTLIDYFAENVKRFNQNSFLTIIDESHMTIPQIRGMYHGDRSRKETLIKYGFRLPSALDNRPLNFEEFLTKTRQNLYVSATPKDWEIERSNHRVIEQLIRPTGLLDPVVELRPTKNQIQDLIIEIIQRVSQNQRVLVTTLTKRMAEDLSDYLNNKNKIKKLVKNYLEKQDNKAELSTAATKKSTYLPVGDMSLGLIDDKFFTQAQVSEQEIKDAGQIRFPKVAYLHSEIETLERSDILDDLRQGKYDVVVGINLLREGLDLPEVSLVAILDADKTGFLRSDTALIQTMGRAARHEKGLAILYADYLSQAMQSAISETQRRRRVQEKYNAAHDITPISINKPIRKKLLKRDKKEKRGQKKSFQPVIIKVSQNEEIDLSQIQSNALTPQDRKNLTKKLTKRMRQAARDMDFELAAILRDKIQEIQL
jgi:excinuclease ABC subunit B